MVSEGESSTCKTSPTSLGNIALIWIRVCQVFTTGSQILKFPVATI